MIGPQPVYGSGSGGGSVSIPVGLQQPVNGGRPFVPLAHYIGADDGGNDAAVQLNATTDLVCISWIQECDMDLSGLAVFQTAEGTQGDVAGSLYAADEDMKPTGSELADLGTVDSGGSADAWLSMTFTAYHLQRGKAYSIVFGVAASVDVSLSTRRVTTAQGSAFPDNAKTFISTDGGSNWTEATQDTTQKALLNIILNPEWPVAGSPVPKLYFGSWSHDSIYIPGSSDLVSIPQAGASLACSALTASTLYYVYAADSSGLTLEASTTVPVYSNGLLVKTGDTNKRLVALIYPRTIIGSYQGPCDVEDQREVIAIDNLVEKPLCKPNPYAATTYNANPSATWMAWNNNSDDWKVSFLSSGFNSIDMVCFASVYSTGTGTLNLNIGINSKTVPHPRTSHANVSAVGSSEVYTGMDSKLPKIKLPRGAHAMWPMQYKQTGGTGHFYYFVTSGVPAVASFVGNIEC